MPACACRFACLPVCLPTRPSARYHSTTPSMLMRLNMPFDAARVTPDTGAWLWMGNPHAVLVNGMGFYGAVSQAQGSRKRTERTRGRGKRRACAFAVPCRCQQCSRNVTRGHSRAGQQCGLLLSHPPQAQGWGSWNSCGSRLMPPPPPVVSHTHNQCQWLHPN